MNHLKCSYCKLVGSSVWGSERCPQPVYWWNRTHIIFIKPAIRLQWISTFVCLFSFCFDFHSDSKTPSFLRSIMELCVCKCNVSEVIVLSLLFIVSILLCVICAENCPQQTHHAAFFFFCGLKLFTILNFFIFSCKNILRRFTFRCF